MQKKILFLILLILSIIITILNIKMYIMLKENKEYLCKQLEIKKEMQAQKDKYYDEAVLEEVTNINTFYKLKFCTEKYFTTIFKLWNEETTDTAQESLLNILATDYKEENDLKKHNIKQIFEVLKQDKTVISKAYQYNIKEGISMYLLSGYNICSNGTNKRSFQLMIVTDTNKNTFKIYPEEYVKKLEINKLQLGVKLSKLDYIEEIEKNSSNVIEKPIITNERIAQDYFDYFIFNIRYDIDVAYNLLDEEYKNKRFPTLQDFKEYIENRKDIYEEEELRDYREFESNDEYMLYILKRDKLELAGYQIRNKENYTRYICIDNYNNYYIFYAISPLNYTVVLDTYTINLPEFTEKYKNGTTEEKVGYNIEKIVNALNSEDYKYVYSKLADEFKENYFKNYEIFEKYAEIVFDIANEVIYNKYTETENLSTYEITLKGKNKTVTKTIVMRLDEGTDFVMSFNIE